MIDGYQISRDRDLPEHVWAYMKKEKFFGMSEFEFYRPLSNSDFKLQSFQKSMAV